MDYFTKKGSPFGARSLEMVLVSVFDSESANMYHFVRTVVRILGLIWIKHELDRINVIGNALAWVF